MRDHAGRIGSGAALIATRELPTPAGNTARTRLYRDRSLALPGITLVQCRAGDRGRAMNDKNKARKGRERELDILGTGKDVFVKPQHWMQSWLLNSCRKEFEHRGGRCIGIFLGEEMP